MTTKAEREHLDAVASMGCIICGAPACIHHLRRNPTTGAHLGMSQRGSNFHVLPLCPGHHTGQNGYHASPRAWEELYGSEIDLWKKVEAILKGGSLLLDGGEEAGWYPTAGSGESDSAGAKND